MKIIRTRRDLSPALAMLPRPLGYVATMGALHAGHAALIAAAKTSCASVIGSVFVNPTQFDNAADLAAYPSDEVADMRTMEAAGCDVVWLPSVAEMYPPGDATAIDPAGPALEWEGSFRPGHFRGMATVVAKLFGLLRPERAFFGEKDWQQLQVVRRMVADLLLAVEIVGVPTVREPDGLAMSSRNLRLQAADRAVAKLLYACLQDTRAALQRGQSAAGALEGARRRLVEAGFTVDYFVLVDAASLRPVETLSDARLIAAARLGRVRLLDNLAGD